MNSGEHDDGDRCALLVIVESNSNYSAFLGDALKECFLSNFIIVGFLI